MCVCREKLVVVVFSQVSSESDDDDADDGKAGAAASLDCKECAGEADFFCLKCGVYFCVDCFNQSHQPQPQAEEGADSSLHRVRALVGVSDEKIERLEVGWLVGQELTQAARKEERERP